ncbi:hypothetical protein NX059_011325 [Plenodomus lindquistii]|nr:hypothetical protein NX059_011325 [Plenodomus lindquistii]
MARLTAPPSSIIRPSLQLPASSPIPIQSAPSTSNPGAKRTQLSRPVLHQAVPKSQIARKATGHSLASPASSRSVISPPRADYEVAAGIFAATQIPRPFAAALKAATAFRRCSQMLQRLPSMIVRPAKALSQPIFGLFESTATSPAPQYLEPEDDNTTGADESTIFCEERDDINNSELLLEDESFDETVDIQRQTTYDAFLARAVVADRRIVSAGHGCAMAPTYTGDRIVLERKRKLPVHRVAFSNQQHVFYTPPAAPRQSKLPFLVWPLTDPVKAARPTVAAPVKPSASRLPRRPIIKIIPRRAAAPAKPPATPFLKRGIRAIRTSVANVAGNLAGKVAGVRASVKPVAPHFLKRATRVMRKLRIAPVKTAMELVVGPVKPPTAKFLKRRNARRHLRTSPVRAAPQVVVASVKTPTATFLKRGTGVARITAVPVKPTAAPVSKPALSFKVSAATAAAIVKPTAAVASTAPALKSAFRNRNFKRKIQPVHFADSYATTTLYSVSDAVDQLFAVSASPDETPEWGPPALRRSRYPVSKAGTGTSKMFVFTSDGLMTPRRQFLNRFASVQRAEALRRRIQAMAAPGQQQDPIQITYGNTDTKISLRVKRKIAREDIGIVMDQSDLSEYIWPKTRPVVVYGRFPGAFQAALIPKKAVTPSMEARQIPKGLQLEEADAWVQKNLVRLQPAGLER